MIAVAQLAREPELAADAATLRYVDNSSEPGFGRRRCGRGFCYLTTTGQILRDQRQLQRIRALAIPPAWTEVWICRTADGHIQATGRDSKGRKQYIYHARWRQVRDAGKFDCLVAFGEALPSIRRRMSRDLRREGVPRRKVLAAIVKLLDQTCVRIGNEGYVEANDSYGLTTLRDRHVEVHGSELDLEFRGKGGKLCRITLDDPRLARIVKRCQDLPGQRLFQYLDEEGQRHPVTSDDVNEYLRLSAGEQTSSKEFRTWTATVTVAVALQLEEEAISATARKRSLKEAISEAASMLGNTSAVCRRSYVHPAIIELYLAGELSERMGHYREIARQDRTRGLLLEEQALLGLLRNIGE